MLTLVCVHYTLLYTSRTHAVSVFFFFLLLLSALTAGMQAGVSGFTFAHLILIIPCLFSKPFIRERGKKCLFRNAKCASQPAPLPACCLFESDCDWLSEWASELWWARAAQYNRWTFSKQVQVAAQPLTRPNLSIDPHVGTIIKKYYYPLTRNVQFFGTLTITFY